MARGLAEWLRRQEQPGEAVGLAVQASGAVSESIDQIRRRLLAEHADLVEATRGDPSARVRLASLVDRMIIEANITVAELTREGLVRACINEIVGFGPLEPLLDDASVSEVMVNGADSVWIERHGKILPTTTRFRDDDQVVDIITRIIAPLGRRIDQASPCVDGRLPDGSRVHAVIPPVAVRGPALTIRRFVQRAESVHALVRLGALTPALAEFLAQAVQRRLNVIISGGTGTGKTTVLNALASCIDPGERVITIEDAAELRLPLMHVVALEARPPNIEGKGEVPIRHLVRNALRMRPDRIIIGECRGAEAFDLLQAMNTGHRGALSTIHANSPADAVARLANMVLMAGEGLPFAAINDQITSAIDIIVHLTRTSEGRRLVADVSDVDKASRAGTVSLRRVYAPGDTGVGCAEALAVVGQRDRGGSRDVG